MTSQFDFHGPNVAYVLELYEQFRQAPNSLDDSTRQFFEQWQPPQITNGAPHMPVAESGIDLQKVVGVVSLAAAIRQYGHLAAQLDPLGTEPLGDPELSLETHNLTEEELRQLPASFVGGSIAETAHNAWEAIQTLREIYASSIGYDNDHIRIPEERMWLREVIESRQYRFDGGNGAAEVLLERLTQIETFELFLQRSFPTKYRFSIEGLDMMVPLLDEIVRLSGDTGMSTIAIAMAHRGRLNVLAHIMEKPYEQILADFKDPLKLQERVDAIGWTIGDVKYHKGVKREVESSQIMLTMPPNPSHLEAVNPVAVGMARAAGTTADRGGAPEFDPNMTMQILIHGDASFVGQGIVAETFNLSRLPGYWTGGTVHIIANNQLGFTTVPTDGRSTLYASDLAKGFKVPIIHVNADDPEAVIEVARIAFAYQDKFEKDIMIDLIGYRRYGHNELDEPGFTQPLMYKTVRQHPTVRELWTQRLIDAGLIDETTAETYVNKWNQILQAAHDNEKPVEELADPQPEQPEAGLAKRTETAISVERLTALNNSLRTITQDFNFYSRRLASTLHARRDAVESDEAKIDWATGEEMAFASILEDGIPIRMSGQEAQRGTFSHRHAVLHDADTGEELIPLQVLPQANAAFEIHNSPLSEEAVLGFEYGYNVQAPNRMVLWEAQYGDFVNTAQSIIDEFVVSAREKWAQTPSLVMLLPHGHEGAGPDHSSARIERFLQHAAKINMRIANCTTAAQYFHLLRRQAMLLETDPLPLVVMSPKSLLRNPDVASFPSDLTEGRWQPVIDDAEVDPQEVDRLVFCSGKFYYDLVGSDSRDKNLNVAVIRVEQLYPFPVDALNEIIVRYKKVKQVVWAQEEPKNMGAWEFMGYRLKKMIGMNTPVNYVGRRRSSSPAEGSRTAHNVNQGMVVEYAFTWKFD